MAAEPRPDVARFEPVRVHDADAPGGFVVVCEHASNHMPAEFGTLGLPAGALTRHIAWDPGALGVARRLAQLLNSPLVESRVSRLVIDCNRPLDAPDLIAEISETTEIPGNRGLDSAARARRVALSHAPFHGALDGLIERRLKTGLGCGLVTVHSFTPVYRGVARPWKIGVIHDSDERLSSPLMAALSGHADLNVGDNQPYAPADRVYYTVERHARSRGLPCVMIEIRNDEVTTQAQEDRWAELLAPMLEEAAAKLEGSRVHS
ncbi:MAG: N-formylglutamate amidohydrolase [Rhizobiaceae bacterium]|nr:N-formylglutamate amidohydrolase [Rhizobiaceae bacterium]